MDQRVNESEHYYGFEEWWPDADGTSELKAFAKRCYMAGSYNRYKIMSPKLWVPGGHHTWREFAEHLQGWSKHLEKEVEHWKANHADQVRRNRVFIERLDMPVERVEAYKYILELEEKVRQLQSLAKEKE